MKKIKSIFIILLISHCLLNAQKIEFPKTNVDLSKIDVSKIDVSKLNLENFSFGLKVSPSINWVDVKHYDLNAGGAALKFAIGGIAEYSINNLISVVSGVNYNGYGGYVFDNNSLNDLTTADNYQLNYSQIEVPLGLKIKTPALKKISYYIQGGLTSGFVLTANEKYKKLNSNLVNQPVDILSLTNPAGYGFQVSVGTELKISKNVKFITDIAYKRALTSTADGNAYFKSGRYTNQSLLEIYPGCMEFSFGFLFK